MQLDQETVWAWTATNLALFALVGMLIFDARAAKTGFSLFAGVFLTMAAFTIGYLYWYPTHSFFLRLTSVVLLAVSLLIFGMAALVSVRHRFPVVFSSVQPRCVVTHGVYRFVRHPFYTAYMLTFVGAAIGCAHAVVAICAAVIVVMYTIAAFLEENRFLRSGLATSYRSYRQQTGMFWPWRKRQAECPRKDLP